MTTLPTHTAKKLGLVIDLDTCVGCQACVIACKGWNTENYGAPLSDQQPYGADPSGTFLNRVHTYEVQPTAAPAPSPPSPLPWERGARNGIASAPLSGFGAGMRERVSPGAKAPHLAPAQIVHFPKSCLHCADAPCVTVCPTGASYKRSEDGIVLVNEDACIGCGLCAWACPYGAREMDVAAGVMKKCTLCIDRIYNENLPEIDREPACVRTCPSGARHFGDFADPDSQVSKLVAARGGFDLMPEQGTKPTNKYLPPRLKDRLAASPNPGLQAVAEGPKGFLGWLDRALDQLPGGKG